MIRTTMYVWSGDNFVRYVTKEGLFSVDTPEELSTRRLIIFTREAQLERLEFLRIQLVFFSRSRTMNLCSHPKKSNNQFLLIFHTR